ncbi:hypothetical protein [Calothrix rhizosoleniae]|uniref:hypothetical protein n=1 Tax=Calothrix rhizosoleniae TaxID=888997 RepID=UPI0030DA7091
MWGGLFTYPAVSQRIESRLNNLEFDLNRLESRLSRIESEISRTGRDRRIPTIPRQSTRRRGLSQRERDRMFDRLATLFIELKQQVQTLEKRVKKLESPQS